MVVRIRFGRGRQVQRGKGKNRKLALALSALLTPAAVMASALGFWRLAADLQWTGEFGIASGIFSHWQVWLTFAAILQSGAWVLNRYGRDHDQARS
jgi:hypothetical protein